MKKILVFALGAVIPGMVLAESSDNASMGTAAQAEQANAPVKLIRKRSGRRQYWVQVNTQAKNSENAEELKLVAPVKVISAPLAKAKVVEAKPAAAKSTEAKPVATESTEVKRAEAKPAEAKPVKWSGKVSAGYMAKTGNTDNSTLNANALIRRTSGDWQYQLRAAAHITQKKKSTTEEDYLAFLRANYTLTPVSYLFGVLGFKSDRFAGYNRRYIQSIGYGHELIETDRHKLWGEIGSGIRQNHLVTGERQQDWIVRANVAYQYKFAEKSEFEQTVQVITGPDNTTTSSDTSLSVPIVGNLGLKLSYTVEHNSDVPADTEKTDTRTAVNIQYSF